MCYVYPFVGSSLWEFYLKIIFTAGIAVQLVKSALSSRDQDYMVKNIVLYSVCMDTELFYTS